MKHATSLDDVSALFEEHADRGELTGILRYSEEPLVWFDIVKSPYSSIFQSVRRRGSGRRVGAARSAMLA